MCGIMAYIGKKQAYPILINGLKKLEYRGYDSSGVAVMNGSLSLLKKKGKVEVLEDFAKKKKTAGNIGLGHTRWATHGVPSDLNAHPHQSESGRLTIVHNGIIENHETLRNMMIENGFTFQSDTDTEVLVQLIEWQQKNYALTTKEAFARALELVEGSFATVLFDLYNPCKLWAARRQSPLILGIGDQDCYLSSDAMPVAEYVDQVSYIENDVIIELDDQGTYTFFDLSLNEIDQPISKVTHDIMTTSKGVYDSYMLKEIYDQPQSVKRLIDQATKLNLERPFDRILITACGTSYHSALIAEYIIEKYAQINVEVEYASEFRYRNPILSERDLVIGISQSGETADTIAALELAKEKECQTMALVNVKNSTIARLVDQFIFLNAGPEIGVASTKAFTNQIVAIVKLMSVLLKEEQTELKQTIEKELSNLPQLINETLINNDYSVISKLISKYPSTIFMGRGEMYPVALEGALKLKEISYIHAEGYPAGEMKHGPIALIDNQMPVISICNNDKHLAKILSNVQEIKARKGIIIIVKSKNVTLPEGLADYVIETPECHDLLASIVQTIPLQMIAYQVATILGMDVDKPRNLAKSVTVE